VATGEGN